MKRHHLIFLITFPGLIALCWTAFAAPAPEQSTESLKTSSETSSGERETTMRIMVGEQKRIQERLQISAPMEIELENGVDPVLEARENGFIIEATLEEVEAALAAAAKTTDPQDDLTAQELKHRGSYRFFTPDSGSAFHEEN